MFIRTLWALCCITQITWINLHIAVVSVEELILWVNANTNEYVDDITDNAEYWCEDCNKHTKLKEV